MGLRPSLLAPHHPHPPPKDDPVFQSQIRALGPGQGPGLDPGWAHPQVVVGVHAAQVHIVTEVRAGRSACWAFTACYAINGGTVVVVLCMGAWMCLSKVSF